MNSATTRSERTTPWSRISVVTPSISARPWSLPSSSPSDTRDRSDYREVVTLALDGYGPEILGVLAARLRSSSDAGETFSMFTEDLRRGLPRFE